MTHSPESSGPPGKPPTKPVRVEPKSWPHYQLWTRVRSALLALPAHFRSETIIEGMLATDIFTLNSALGATIEEQVVRTLNALRPVWDPDKNYETYAFIRQPQAFPDVRLQRRTNGADILMGIELKGWYVLAKEGEPSFRFTANPDACNPWDLIAVVPWVLSNVLSGSPVVLDVFIDSARYTAEQRNYYWQYERGAKGDVEIVLAKGARPYPDKGDKIADHAKSDEGDNFGRIARYGTMEQYVTRIMQTEIRGVPASEWLKFFKQCAKKGANR
jgi:hypothetical protein